MHENNLRAKGGYGLRPSMSRRGNCWGNAVAESLFSSLKKERVKKRIYNTRKQATDDIGDYIENFYNRTRRHQHLAGVCPEQFEAAAQLLIFRCPRDPGNSNLRSTKDNPMSSRASRF